MQATSYIISLVVSLVCAFFCYRIATDKDRHQVLWTVLGFLFSIIALIVIALLPSKRPQAPAET